MSKQEQFNEECKDNNQGAFYIQEPFKNQVPMCICKVDVEKMQSTFYIFLYACKR